MTVAQDGELSWRCRKGDRQDQRLMEDPLYLDGFLDRPGPRPEAGRGVSSPSINDIRSVLCGHACKQSLVGGVTGKHRMKSDGAGLFRRWYLWGTAVEMNGVKAAH
jgi:hypothetical protein